MDSITHVRQGEDWLRARNGQHLEVTFVIFRARTYYSNNLAIIKAEVRLMLVFCYYWRLGLKQHTGSLYRHDVNGQDPINRMFGSL